MKFSHRLLALSGSVLLFVLPVQAQAAETLDAGLVSEPRSWALALAAVVFLATLGRERLKP